ncbi:tetratricopeptide repeat protein [Geminocystis herdmanii]|uniref:tetratricopeptide repeat protein n=1 Tax=Geminocystis herdmanii TaxID=669359 RepID=UPI00034C0196|nr:tetratricopeptide repeat protein [Geminocystis herdmanii]
MKVNISKLSLTTFVFILFLFTGKSSLVLAQTEEVKVNPLLVDFKDELLPTIKRDLTGIERKRIQAKINDLDTLALEESQAGNDDIAFALWYRSINLSRALGTKEEITMISKVGKIAWDKSRNEDINFLNERLLKLELEYTKDNNINPEYLPLFIEGYEALHNLDKSIAINKKNLELARANNDISTIKTALEKLGRFYLAKFDYYRAEPIYQELLNIARLELDYLAEGLYLRQLAEISGEIINPENAIKYKRELAENYVKNQNLLRLSLIKISIGDDYKALKKPDESAKSYQEAFSLAWSLQQYSIAGDALEKLGILYQEYEQLDSALEIYQELIKLQQLSYNHYGLMKSYDSMGIIYQKKNDYSSALKSYEKALAIARSLSHQENYFITKIDELQNVNNKE